MIFITFSKKWNVAQQMVFMDHRKLLTEKYAFKIKLLSKGCHDLTTFSSPPINRHEFRSSCDVELAGEDCISLQILGSTF